MSDGKKPTIFELWDAKPEPEAPTPISPAGGLTNGKASSYAAAALRREADAVATTPNGQRNQRLNKAWFNLGRHVGAGNIDAETVKAELRAAGLACGLPAWEVDTVLREGPTSALKAGYELPRHPDPRPATEAPRVTVLDQEASEEITPEDAAAERSAGIRKRFPILDWRELWDAEDDEDEWIVEPILPARRLVALFSAPKVGKSLLMLEVAVRVSQGAYVLGVTPDRPRRVLYVDFENDPRGDVRERLRGMGVKPNQLDNLCYLSYPTLAKLDTWQGAADLMAAVTEYGCEVVVIDTISRAVGGEENENDTWLNFYRHTGLAMKQAGVSCIRLDHTGKDHEKGMRGGSAKYGDVDAVWKLSKVAEDTYRLDCTDHRMRVAEEVIVLTREASPYLTHRVAAEGRTAAFRAKVRDVVAALDGLNLSNDTSRRQAAEALRGLGQKVRNDVVSQAVKERKIRFGARSWAVDSEEEGHLHD